MQLRSCRITGDPIRLEKPSQLALPIDFTDVEIRSELYLEGVVVRAPLTFVNVDFLENVSLPGVVFEQGASFNNVRFEGLADFGGIVLSTYLSFKDCHFARQATFSNSKLTDQAQISFSGDQMDVPLDFSESTIHGKLTLEGEAQTFQVKGKVYLNGINYKKGPSGILRLKNTEFHDELYLDRSEWALLDFAESERGLHRPIRFLGFFDFRDSKCNFVNFAGVEFEGGGDLTRTEFRQCVDFERAKFRKPLRLRWSQIENQLGKLKEKNNGCALTGEAPSELDKLDCDLFTAGKLNEPDDLQTYDELERNFSELADLESKNECSYHKHLVNEGLRWKWAFLGYGVRPLNPFVSFLTVFLVSCIFNAWLFRKKIFSGGTLRWWLRPVHLFIRVAIFLKKGAPVGYTVPNSGKVVLGTEFAVMAFLVSMFILAWMNKSPLLKELIPYVLPK